MRQIKDVNYLRLLSIVLAFGRCLKYSIQKETHCVKAFCKEMPSGWLQLFTTRNKPLVTFENMKVRLVFV